MTIKNRKDGLKDLGDGTPEDYALFNAWAKQADTNNKANCPYCHKGKPIVDDSIALVLVASDAGQLWFNSNKFVGHDEAEFVNIAYCPMCGRRLDD
jgi:hypothetical protein